MTNRQSPLLFGLLLLAFITVAESSRAAPTSKLWIEDFTNRANYNSGTAIWNQATGWVTPTLVVKAWDDGSVHTSNLDVGDGSLGDFNSLTWAHLAASVDVLNKIIYLNTALHSIFKFRNFTLDAGWTLDSVGNAPLVLYVLGDMTVNGVITCSGHNGTSSIGSAGTAVAGVGGEGRCGGSRGGDGGAVYSGAGSSSAQNGSSPAIAITGGQGGTISGAGNGSGGGGGGSWGNGGAFIGTAGTTGTIGSGGAAGTQVSNPNWTQYFGGAGGGGGSGSSLQAGGGGSGGGGILVVHVGRSLSIGVSGQMSADGGSGGSSPSSGGGGGAGGAGSVQTWVGQDLTLLGAAANTISARTGSAGSPASGGSGGLGWGGRTWTSTPLTNGFFNASGASIDPTSQLTYEGDVEFSVASQFVISQSFDTESTLAHFISAAILPASANVSVEFSGSNDSFISDNSGWVSSSQISSLDHKRYLRFRLSLNNLSGTAPEKVHSMTVNFESDEKKNFVFKNSGCGLIQPSQSTSQSTSQQLGPSAFSATLFAFFLLLLPLFLLGLLQCSIPKVKPAE